MFPAGMESAEISRLGTIKDPSVWSIRGKS